MDTKITKKENVNPKQLDNLLMQEFFKILTEPIRIELIKYLAINGPSDISTIANNFTQDRSVISKHLKMMNKAGIVILTKSSRRSIYQVDGMELLLKMESIVEDMKTLLRYTCKDTFDYLYSKNMNYNSYLKQLEDNAPIK